LEIQQSTKTGDNNNNFSDFRKFVGKNNNKTLEIRYIIAIKMSTTTLFWGGKFSGKLATTTKSTKIRSQIANNSPTSQLVVVFC
jgi:hypothetical protein